MLAIDREESMTEILVYCDNHNCGTPLNEYSDTPVEKRQPCPKCGSLSRTFHLKPNDEINVKDFFVTKKRSPFFPSKKKLRIYFKQGDQIDHKTGKWVFKKWRIDKDVSPAWYLELVIDPETGEKIHHDEGPLDKHQGHGSDKTD